MNIWKGKIRNYEKRILSILLSVLMVVFVFPVSVFAEEHNHNGWIGGNSLPDTAGYYYLTTDVTLDATWTVPTGTTNLCLNGHVINANGGNFSVITVPDGATLNLYDCGTTEHNGYVDENGLWHLGEKAQLEEGETSKIVSGGVITGGNNTAAGGGVYVNHGIFTMYGGTISGNKTDQMGGGVNVSNSGKFNMTSGSISGNSASTGGGVSVANDCSFKMGGGSISGNVASNYGGGVSTSGALTMTGGSISGNKASSYGGGVYFTTGSFTMTDGSIIGNTASSLGGGMVVGGILTLGGSAVFKNNTLGDTANNVLLLDNKYITIDTNTALTSDFNVGVTTYTAPSDTTPVKITTNGASTDTQYFTPDNADYEVKFISDHLELTVKTTPSHTHNPVKVNGQSASETASGWKDYYECACGALFEDATGNTSIENLATWKSAVGNGYIAPLGHDDNENRGKSDSDNRIIIDGNAANDELDEENNPETGAPVINIGAATAILSLTFVLSKKH